MSLQTDLEALAASVPDQVMGVAVTDLNSRQSLAALNADRPFQLASMFKIPVLVATLRQVDAGRLDLAARYPLQTHEKLIGSGILSYFDAGLAPTLRDLITLMIIVSDNTATDKVLEILGGPPAVDAVLRDLGIEGIRVRHTTRDLLWAVFPADALLLTDAELAQYRQEHDLPDLSAQVAPDAATNTGTPAALNRLLETLADGECASPESTRMMLTILRQQTYNQRLPRTWPEETVFAHKTGTLAAMRGDTGILMLPGRQIAISAIVETVGVPLPLTPAQQEAGNSTLARVGELVFSAVG